MSGKFKSRTSWRQKLENHPEGLPKGDRQRAQQIRQRIKFYEQQAVRQRLQLNR